jgi:hypothetical protein
MDNQHRVHAAADALTAEGIKPTVTQVRERAGCSMADASKFLRAWRTDQTRKNTAKPTTPLPESLVGTVERTMGLLWSQAVNTARAEHEAALENARKLVENARAETEELITENDILRTQLATAREDTTRAITVQQETQNLCTQLRADITVAYQAQSQAEGITVGLREALNILKTKTTNPTTHQEPEKTKKEKPK